MNWYLRAFCGRRFVVFLTFLIVLCGCGGGGGGSSSSDDIIPSSCTPDYEGVGDWPDYSGGWESIYTAAGSKYETWAYLDLTIYDNGTFDGTYEDYLFSYIWMMDTAWGQIPTEVYNPAGNKQAVSGYIDFDNLVGAITMCGKEEVEFEVIIHSSSEIAFVFPDGFDYTVANVQR